MVMRCPACGAENPDNSQYCNLCLECIGFENLEYTTSVPTDEGYLQQYPSSFEGGAQQAGGAPMTYPEAQPPSPSDPVSIGEYGQHSGAIQPDPYVTQGFGNEIYQEPLYEEGERTFPWGKALLMCLYVSMAAASLSVMLELMMSFLALGAMMSGNLTAGQFWLLIALLIPVAVCGFYPGYRMEAYGWALGLITVGIWAFIMRPLYYAILGWMFSERFTFTMVFDRVSLLFIFGLFLPLGALLGWLGQKRSTTGLWI